MEEKTDEEQKKLEADKAAEGAKQKKSEEDKGDGVSTEEKDKIPAVEEAKKAAADLKEQMDRKEKLIEREEKLQDRKESVEALGGGSPAGKPESKEETPKEYKDRVMAGDIETT